jgi:hypothetical protein
VSLFSPLLAPLQGPALLCLFDRVLSAEDVCALLTPGVVGYGNPELRGKRLLSAGLCGGFAYAHCTV